MSGGRAASGRTFRDFVWAALGLAPAIAADMSSLGSIHNTMPPPEPVIAPPGPSTYINFLDEVRFGVYAHNWIYDDKFA